MTEKAAMKRGIETLARGVCVMSESILLCRNRKIGNVYLPGGHIEFGETGAEALAREIQEEMGCRVKVGRFMGCAEHTFLQQGNPHAEINLVYELRVTGLAPDRLPPCTESWIEFFWHPLKRLAFSRCEPAALRRSLPKWLASPAAGNLATTPIERPSA